MPVYLELTVEQARLIREALEYMAHEQEVVASAGILAQTRDRIHKITECRRIASYIRAIGLATTQSMPALLDSDVPYPVALSPEELHSYSHAVTAILRNMVANATKRPKMTTLMEEVAEAILASRGKHDDPLSLELTQIAGVCGNMLWQIEMGVDVANLRTQR